VPLWTVRAAPGDHATPPHGDHANPARIGYSTGALSSSSEVLSVPQVP
jgi:hypothetical protein